MPKYYFLKWQFDPAVVEPILVKANVQCAINGRIVEVRRGELSPDMPHVIAVLDDVTLLENESVQ